MIFNSLAFAVFLPIVLAIYHTLTRRAQNAWLLAASYVFYGWWDVRFLSLLWLSTIVDFTCARRIEATSSPRGRRAWLLVTLGTNLTVLGFFKYFDFFAGSAAHLLRPLGLAPPLPVLHVVLPIGISFYTFQTMSYSGSSWS